MTDDVTPEASSGASASMPAVSLPPEDIRETAAAEKELTSEQNEAAQETGAGISKHDGKNFMDIAAEQKKRRLPAVLLSAMRPRQWTKNAAVLAPLFFSHNIFDGQQALRGITAAGAFCLLSSAVYIGNDIVDRERDKMHPVKCRRPIASGELSLRGALILSVLLAGGALAAFAWLGTTSLICALSYIALQLLYRAILKKQVIVDVIAIAIGFVLRVATGAVAISVPISNWLYLCTFLLALFLGFSKRRAELSLLQKNASDHRPGLEDLSLPLLDQLIPAVTASTILAFALYTMSQETIAKFGSDRLMLTLPCVVYGIFRYLYLVYRKGGGGSPEKLLLQDKPLLIDIALFVIIAGLVIYL